MRKIRFAKRILSVVLCVALCVSTLQGCGTRKQPSSEDIANNIVDEIVNTIKDSESSTGVEATMPDAEAIENEGKIVRLSSSWEDYVGDIETFVYGLIANELGYSFDVFPAYTLLSDDTEIYGIGYSNYEECYANDDETEYAFLAGFIPYYGENVVPDDEFDSGLTVYDMDYSGEEGSFVLAYQSESYTDHCVVYGQYLHYGIDENGRITYSYEEYEKGKCDEELGSLYSYDESRFVFENSVGESINISGTSLYSQIDYDELEAEINEILRTQDKNSVSIDIESAAYFAQEAIESYFLSLQEETFLGYDVDSLIEAAKELDPLECYRITSEGLMSLTLEPGQDGASSLVKWLVGTSCVIVAAVGIVSAMVFIECPVLSSAAGAVTGLAIEIFMQVVISGENLEDINWGKVALAAAAGAISGFLGPYVYATTSGAGYFLVDSALDGLIGGIERSVGTWLDGGDGQSIIKSFGFGFALGFGLSAAFKGAGAFVGHLANKVGPKVAKLSQKLFPKLTKNVSAFAKKVGKEVGKKLYAFKQVADASPFHSKYIANKIAFKQLARLQAEGADWLEEKSFSHLNNKNILDANKNPITKETLEKTFKEATDGTVIGYFDMGDEVIEIVKKNGMVSVLFDNSKYQTVFIKAGLVADRDINFEEAAKELKKAWVNDPSQIPDSISTAIKRTNIDLEDMEPEKLVDIIRKSDWVLHENPDMQSISLVSRAIHKEIKHMGGYGLAKNLKYHMGREFFERLVSSAASGAVIATE